MLKLEKILILLGYREEEIREATAKHPESISVLDLIKLEDGAISMRIFPNLNYEEKELFFNAGNKYLIPHIHLMYQYCSETQKEKLVEIIKILPECDSEDDLSKKTSVIIDTFHGESNSSLKLLNTIKNMSSIKQKLTTLTYIFSRCTIDQKLYIGEIIKAISPSDISLVISTMPVYIKEDLSLIYNLFSKPQQEVLDQFGIEKPITFADIVKAPQDKSHQLQK